MAYNLPHAKLTRVPATSNRSSSPVAVSVDTNAVAWVIGWQQMQAAGVLQDLLTAGVRVRAATKPFSMAGTSGSVSFSEGSLAILAGIQDEGKASAIIDILQQATAKGVNVHSYQTQLTSTGPGLGTSHFKLVKPIKPSIGAKIRV